MNTLIIENLTNQDIKLLKPLLDKLGYDYSNHTIKEVEDPEALAMLEEWKKSPVLSQKETKKALKELGVL